MKATELREMTPEELQTRLKECQHDLVNFRLQLATGVVENTRRARMTRRDIARIKTVQREREIQVAKGAK